MPLLYLRFLTDSPRYPAAFVVSPFGHLECERS